MSGSIRSNYLGLIWTQGLKWASVWTGIAFWWSCFGLNCAQIAPGGPETDSWPEGLNWHFAAETDLFNIQCIVCLLWQWIKAYNCLVPRHLSLSLDENVRAKEGGKETPFPWSLAAQHQSHAFRAHLYHSKNEAPEEEAGLTRYPWLASQFNYTFLTKIKIEENIKKVCFR